MVPDAWYSFQADPGDVPPNDAFEREHLRPADEESTANPVISLGGRRKVRRIRRNKMGRCDLREVLRPPDGHCSEHPPLVGNRFGEHDIER